MQTPFDAALAELKREIKALDLKIENLESVSVDLSNKRSDLAAEVRGFERAREMLGGAGGATPAAEPKPAVRRLVMAMFGPEGGGSWGNSWSEPELVGQTGLPEEVVHGFLVHAVAHNTLRRDGDVYSLPGLAEPEPAAVPGQTGMAEE